MVGVWCVPVDNSTSPPVCFALGTGKGGKKKTSEKAEEGYLDMEVCRGANVCKTGDDPPVKDPLAYPSWLWTLLEDKELSPESKLYWRRINKRKARERNRQMKLLS